MLRLFSLFISYRSGGHYCGVYPSLEYLYEVIKEMVQDMEIDESETPPLNDLKEALERNDDYWHEFSDTTWIQVQETSPQLVELIVNAKGKPEEKLSLAQAVYNAVFINTDTFDEPAMVDEKYPPDATPAGSTLAYLLGAIMNDRNVDLDCTSGKDYQFLLILKSSPDIGDNSAVWKYITTKES